MLEKVTIFVKEAGFRKILISFILFYIFPYFINSIPHRIVWKHYSCHGTSFLPYCDIEPGTNILFITTMLTYPLLIYYVWPFPLAIPTVLSFIFLKTTSRKKGEIESVNKSA